MASTTTNRRQGVNSGAAVKVPCRCATTANITLSGLQTIDGVTVVADDRVLVKEQNTASENGVYVASTSTWQRAIDFDGTFDVVQGTLVPVANGTTYEGQVFRVTTANPITLGSSSLAFEFALTAATLSFLQSGTGATATTVQNELRQLHFNVMGFGATGDGTTDDSAAIQAAITACGAAGGGIVFFPEGVYVATGLTVSSDQVALIGTTTKGSRIRFTNTTGTLLTVTGALFRLDGFEIESPSATHTAGAIIDVQGSQGKVSNIRITGNFWNCFKLETDGKGGWFFDMIRVTGSNTLNSLFRVKGTATTVADNHVINLFSATTVTWTEGAIILDTFTDTFGLTAGTLGGGGAPLILIRDSGNNLDPRFIHIDAMYLENGSSDADLVQIDAGDDIRFSNSYFGTALDHVKITAGHDISIKNSCLISAQQSSILLNGGTRVAIDGNSFLGAGLATDLTYSFISVAAGVSEWSLRNNTFREHDAAANNALRPLTIASGASNKFSYGGNDWGVAGTDWGTAGDTAVLDASSGTNVVVEQSIPTLLYRGAATVNHTGTTASTAVISMILPAGALRTRDGVRIHAAGTTTGTAGTKDMAITFGGTTVSAIQVPQANTDTWELIATVYNANAVSGSNSQMFIGHATRSAADTEGGEHRLKSAGASIDTTGAVTITLTVQLGDGGDAIITRVFEAETLRR